jgi:putative phosphoesterase
MIIHAGDLTDLRVIDVLEGIATVHAVAGNMDSWPVKSSLQPKMTLHLCGKTIVVFHGAMSHGATEEAARTQYPEADCVIFGHTHQSVCDREGKTLIFNPGTASRIFGSRPSYGILTITEGKPIEGEIFEV